MGRLAGKRALITGGSSGIGLATARVFIAEGARVAITSIDEQGLAAAAAELGEACVTILNDAGDTTAIGALRDSVLQRLGPPDILFLNAGIGAFSPLSELTEAQFDKLFSLHVKGPLFTVQKLAPDMPDGGSIIFTSSNSARTAVAGSHAYAAAKAGSRQLARTLARELAPRNIRVNAILPGATITNLGPSMNLSEQQATELNDFVLGHIPLKRYADASELARAVLFLASDDSSYMTAGELLIDGGWVEAG